MNNTEPEKHLRLGPSKAHRWLVCPHSISVEVTEVENEAARKGKVIHNLAARVLTERTYSIEEYNKHASIVEPYVHHIVANQADEMLVETFWQSKIHPDFGGTCDAALFVEDACAIYDLKTGKWPVEAVDNPQMLSYASIIQEYRPWITEFYGVIVQPKSSDGQVVKPVALYDLEQLENHRNQVRWAAESDDLVTGNHCRFCPLRKANLCEPGVEFCENLGWA